MEMSNTENNVETMNYPFPGIKQKEENPINTTDNPKNWISTNDHSIFQSIDLSHINKVIENSFFVIINKDGVLLNEMNLQYYEMIIHFVINNGGALVVDQRNKDVKLKKDCILYVLINESINICERITLEVKLGSPEITNVNFKLNDALIQKLTREGYIEKIDLSEFMANTRRLLFENKPKPNPEWVGELSVIDTIYSFYRLRILKDIDL
jgi:hypothetical protein